ncbi:polysulfide reductase NrfD [Candidatus Sulcia muelleri]|uniref:NrfD/PsrC family molybdoenzyme membrane anchor subunit n=1 Tax=Candidatus Karelsulcia muelleri TaxID=336810 RepID=UPI001F86492E|nr:NrfD/PsrC family molybdoenzyme membrane anchor subunit [Candidatus Karelsulcia muelleri]NHU72467.1 polysulfide reductase NrfD [Candidatus Karelsulcia muelleri]
MSTPLILGRNNYTEISNSIIKPIKTKASKLWWISFICSLMAFIWGVICILYTIHTGIGVWGLNKTINWAWDITNFVWWVGIGHAGTLISAVLFLFRQKWRLSINRSAEAMTIFAVIQAAIFPIIHMGRPWNAYWVFPIPNQFGTLWPNFNSPLLWDVFAISTYFSVSLVFWFIGLIPDFAMIRDKIKNPFKKKIYNILSFGWGGDFKQWQLFEKVSLLLAGICTPLVFSVHTIVSFDFATSVIKGWHSTIFPPYFIAGAIFSGFAMVQILLGIMRKLLKLENFLTKKHLECMNLVILVTGGIVAMAYIAEYILAWYSNNPFEDFIYFSSNAAIGHFWWAFWALIICNMIIPQLLWVKKIRTNYLWSFLIAIFINIGMWFERFNIIVLNLSHDYLPSSWVGFFPSFVDLGIFIGTNGLFFLLYLIYIKSIPVISQSELKTILK